MSRSVALDGSSAWHISALLSAAIESATLPARLKDPLNRDTLGDMAETLNAMGKQTIAGLAMSVAPAEQDPSRSPSQVRQQRTSRLTEEELTEGVSLDMRFTPSDQVDAYAYQSRRNGFPSKTPKVFSQLVALRGYPAGDGDVEMDQDRWNQRRRRNVNEPITRRWVV